MMLLQKPEMRGRLISRILPVGITADYEQTCKPLLRIMDPSILAAGTGYANFNPWADSSVFPSCLKKIDSELSNGKEQDSQDITLDIYLFDSRATAGNVSSTHIRMNRAANEPVSKTLKRMEVSLSKKFKSVNSNHKGQKGRPVTSDPETPSSCSLWRWSSNNGNGNSTMLSNNWLDYYEPWDVSTTLTNAQVWGQTDYASLAVLMTMGDLSIIPLLVEQNPPSIVGVRTFEGFTGHIHTQTPLVVEVDMIHGTHAMIDWYVDGVLTSRDSPYFIPQDEHVGKHVSILITPTHPDRQHDGSGCQEAYRFERPVETIPENIILSLRPDWTLPRVKKSDVARVLRAVCYNILADQNAFSGDNDTPFYPYVPANILRRSRRMPLILHEILSYQPDIICLQEVDEFVYQSLFRPVLNKMGYQGFFSVKQTGGTQEGCAMFWSLTKFEQAADDEMHTHVLRDLFPKPDAMLKDTTWKSLSDIQNLLTRRPDLKEIIDHKLGHVLQTAYLRPRRSDTGESSSSSLLLPDGILVANTHLFYHPLADHIRLMQTFVSLHQLDQERTTDCPILYCGDFNTSPTNCAVRLILDRSVPKNFNRLQQHLRAFHWGDCETSAASLNNIPLDDFPALEIPDHFPTLVSAYGDKPPLFTHYISSFHGCLDHLFSSLSTAKNKHSLKTMAMAPMPTISDVSRHVAMPSEFLPSDHVSLVVDLEFTCFEEKSQEGQESL